MERQFTLSRELDVVQGSFGASQMWFQKNRQIMTGCGPAALANLFAWTSSLSLSREEMLRLMTEILKFLKGPVVLPGQFIAGARRFYRTKGFDLNAEQLLVPYGFVHRYRKLKDLLIRSLASDIPPLLLMGPNRGRMSDYRRDFQNHWVVVTSLEIRGTSTFLTVSSWGQEFSLDLDQLASSKAFLAAVSLHPRRKP